MPNICGIFQPATFGFFFTNSLISIQFTDSIDMRENMNHTACPKQVIMIGSEPCALKYETT